VLFAAFWARLARLDTKNRQLVEMVDARTAELAQANSVLSQLSVTDPLTGLRNRRHLDLSLPAAVAQVNRVYRDRNAGFPERAKSNVDIAFFIVDIDRFKSVNDRFGHAAGDKVLVSMASLLGAATRESDAVVRWGGEEFLIVARNSNRLLAKVLANRVVTEMRRTEFEIGGGTSIRLTCSLGFAVYPFFVDEPERVGWNHLVGLADHCLYAAKQSGRDAWIGLQPRTGVTAGDFPGAFSNDDPRSISSSPLVNIETSLDDPAAIVWD